MSSPKDTNDNIIQIPSLGHVPDSRGLGYLFFTNMEKNKDKIAQIDATTGEKDTFGAFRQRCIRTAIAMRSRGLTNNDIITILSENHLNCFTPIISALFLGIKSAPLDPTLSLNDTIYLLKQINPKIVFVMPKAVELIENAIKELNENVDIVVFSETDKHTPFSDFLQTSEEENSFQPIATKDLMETAFMFFSSGTTGFPKGVCVSHYAFIKQIYNTLNFGFTLDITSIGSTVYWLIVAHFYGVLTVTGKARLYSSKLDIKLLWEKIREYKPTLLFIPPFIISQLCNVAKPEGLDTSFLKDINMGGTTISENKILQLREMFPGTRINLSYGMTEGVGFLSCFNLNRPEDLEFADKNLTSSGKGVPGFSYKVVDIETEEILGPNQNGELRIKSDCLFNTYYLVEPPDVYDCDGWFKTGDIVYYDEDECFYIVGRIKEVMRVRLRDVHPVVIEDVLLTHPAIKAAAVFGISHEIEGHHPMAIVVLKENAGEVTPEQIEKYVEERVEDVQRLRAGVKIVDSIPTTSSGKIKKNELKKLYLKR